MFSKLSQRGRYVKNRKFAFDYEHTSGGLVVTRVAASDSGLRCGDVIISLQGRRIASMQKKTIDALITHLWNVNGNMAFGIVRHRPEAVDDAPAAPAPATPAPTPAPTNDPESRRAVRAAP